MSRTNGITYVVERESFDQSRFSKASISANAIKTLGAPRNKMWIIRRSAVDGANEHVFIERMTANPDWDGYDLTDELIGGMRQPKLSGNFRLVFSRTGRVAVCKSWASAKLQIRVHLVREA